MEARVSSAADPNGSAALLLALYSTDGPEYVQQVGQGGILVVLVPHQADVGKGNPQQGDKSHLALAETGHIIAEGRDSNTAGNQGEQNRT